MRPLNLDCYRLGWAVGGQCYRSLSAKLNLCLLPIFMDSRAIERCYRQEAEACTQIDCAGTVRAITVPHSAVDEIAGFSFVARNWSLDGKRLIGLY